MPPVDAAGRLVWLKETWDSYFKSRAEKSRVTLTRRYGAQRADTVNYAEYFELCEYGDCPNPEDLWALFP
jgi:hypothetical protein